MTANNIKNFGRKLSKAAELLSELGEQLDSLAESDQGFDQGSHDVGGAAPPPQRRAMHTEIDEPEIGWRMGFIRLCDGRCPWCGERIELVTCDSNGSGLTWKCPEGCNP